MKQLSQNLRTGKLTIDEVPAPALLPGQVLVKTAFSLISAGTERTKIETGKKSLVGKALARPDQVRQVLQSVSSAGLQATYQKVITKLDSRSPIGYSASGVVLAVGPGVDEFHPGDAVACAGATAGHAEIIAVPTNLCAAVPHGVGLDAAAFTTVGAIALQGIRQADSRLGECVVVMGLGLLGALTVQMLKAAGCLVVGFDPNPARCQLALQLGADVAAEGEGQLRSELARLTASKGADAVIITAGTRSNHPVEFAGEISRDKGRVIIVGAVGLSLPRAPYYDKELDLRLSRSYGPGRYDANYEEKGIDYPYGYVRWTERRNMQAFLHLVATGKVDVQTLITHRFALNQAVEAYDLITGKTKESFTGVLFQYDPEKTETVTRIALKPARPASNGKLAVGVIGAGNFAQSMLLPHLKADPRVELKGVATVSPLGTRDAGERFGFDYAATGHEEILSDSGVKAVVVATRHDSHAALVVEALRAGKAIHVEKPLAMLPGELDDILAAYQAAESPFVLVGFNRRFAPLMQEMMRFFGKPTEPFAVNYRVNAGFIPADHWTQDPQQGGGRIVGEVCHFVDLVQFACQSTIETVYARALPNLGKYCTDNLSIVLGLANGSVGTVTYLANGDKALPKEYLEVFNQGRIAILDDFKSLSLYSGGSKKVSRSAGQDKGHKAEMAAWVSAIQEGRAEPVPFADSVQASRAVFAIQQSLNEGRVVCLG